ncbi:MAG: hypothetical protein HYR80_05440, partial [Nitrospirae bacterium]|nr:hypothetical protein [Nitrospirota bacterium]
MSPIPPPPPGGIIGAFFSNKIGENSAALRKAVQTVHAEFACYEETLSRSKYLAGASLSAADILFLP